MDNITRGIGDAARAYFKGIGHISQETNSMCKSWYVQCVPMMDTENATEFKYALEFTLTVFDECNGENCGETCNGDGDYHSEVFTILLDSETECEEWAEYFMNANSNCWILAA